MRIDFPPVIAAALIIGTLMGTGMFPIADEWQDSGQAREALEQPYAPPPNVTPPRVPTFADRARIPASGTQGQPGEAATLTGDPKRGSLLFVEYCESCHGPSGTDRVPNPGSTDGTVPPLNPIDPAFVNTNPSLFAANLDRMIQHGSLPDGPRPALFMPDWGDSKTLSQQTIADLEAYVMLLNGVERGKKEQIDSLI